MKYFRYSLFVLALLCLGVFAQDVPSCLPILTYIEKHLPLSGTLKKCGDFVYVDLDDEYVHKIIDFIQKDEFQEPPYFGNADLVGAHITVIYPAEVRKHGVQRIEECGKKIDFTPIGCKIVHPPTWDGVKEVYIIVVDAPELDAIRRKYGLPEKKYDFHITVGVKSAAAKAA